MKEITIRLTNDQFRRAEELVSSGFQTLGGDYYKGTFDAIMNGLANAKTVLVVGNNATITEGIFAGKEGVIEDITLRGNETFYHVRIFTEELSPTYRAELPENWLKP